MQSNTRASVPFVQWLLENFPPEVNTAQISKEEMTTELRRIYHVAYEIPQEIRDGILTLESSEYEVLTVLHGEVDCLGCDVPRIARCRDCKGKREPADNRAIEAIKYAAALYRDGYKSGHYTRLKRPESIRTSCDHKNKWWHKQDAYFYVEQLGGLAERYVCRCDYCGYYIVRRRSVAYV